MRLKLISDGTHEGTKVINAETGEALTHVVRFVREWDRKGLDHLTVTVLADDRIKGRHPDGREKSAVALAAEKVLVAAP